MKTTFRAHANEVNVTTNTSQETFVVHLAVFGIDQFMHYVIHEEDVN